MTAAHCLFVVGCSGKSRRPALRSGERPSLVPQRTWCCPRARPILRAKAEPDLWNVLVPLRSQHSAQSTCSSAAQLGRRARQNELRRALQGTYSQRRRKVREVSSTARQAASFHGLPLETLTLLL